LKLTGTMFAANNLGTSVIETARCTFWKSTLSKLVNLDLSTIILATSSMSSNWPFIAMQTFQDSKFYNLKNLYLPNYPYADREEYNWLSTFSGITCINSVTIYAYESEEQCTWFTPSWFINHDWKLYPTS
jgi:hypothetical protein